MLIPMICLPARGQLSVDMSYRGDDVGNPAYPAKGAQRGSAKHKDTYYFTGLHLTYRIGSGMVEEIIGGGGAEGKTVPVALSMFIKKVRQIEEI